MYLPGFQSNDPPVTVALILINYFCYYFLTWPHLQPHPMTGAPTPCPGLHVRAVRTCKFDAGMCVSPACVMFHRAAPLGSTSASGGPQTTHVSVVSVVGTRGHALGPGHDAVPLCEFFNRKSGCLSRRSTDFLCQYRHACARCGNTAHGAWYCPMAGGRVEPSGGPK